MESIQSIIYIDTEESLLGAGFEDFTLFLDGGYANDIHLPEQVIDFGNASSGG